MLCFQDSCLLASVVQVPQWGCLFSFLFSFFFFDLFSFPSLKLFLEATNRKISGMYRGLPSYFVLFLFLYFTGKWVLWVIVDRCGSLWVVLDRCGSFWIVVGRCQSFWVFPRFSNYGLLTCHSRSRMQNNSQQATLNSKLATKSDMLNCHPGKYLIFTKSLSKALRHCLIFQCKIDCNHFHTVNSLNYWRGRRDN